ncbi:MAG: DegT/DnrJ/EryC1/StrS family aminotransferase [Candidatus Magasanikbacteria bacterium]|nr:DegT/DnrJ/EryC1/StrS family aminotransferase [Candidatus Magasanikbacteria bacterium]
MQRRKEQIGVGCADITEQEIRYVNEVLKTKRLSYGPFTQKFESGFAKLHGCKRALMVNSGTSALRIAVAALKEIHGWKDGDEIICPAVTFVASSNVIIMNGLEPVFADVSPQTYNLDPAEIEKHITKRTRAIMVVHLFGQPAEMDPIMKIARKYKLKVIEDSCETMFVKYKGKPVGSFGDISCFSTYVAHFIVTGVGGLAHDKDLTPKKFQKVVESRFKFLRLGYSFRATEMESALGLAQLERKDDIVRRRKYNAKYFLKKLKKFEKYLQLPTWPKYSDHAFMMFPIVVKEGVPFKRNELIMHLELANIETRDMVPLINQPVYIKRYGNLEKNFPVSKWINHNGFYIGTHQMIEEKDLEYVVKAFEEFFAKKNIC